jgi:hypothetical protein
MGDLFAEPVSWVPTIHEEVSREYLVRDYDTIGRKVGSCASLTADETPRRRYEVILATDRSRAF